jgi:hypothetical protein
VHGGSENSWKGVTVAAVRAQRRGLVQSVVEAQGREVNSRRTVRVTVKVYTPGVGQACGERGSVCSGRK